MSTKQNKEGKKYGIINYLLVVLLVVSFIINSFFIGKVNAKMNIKNIISIPRVANLFTRANSASGLTGNLTDDAISLILYKGVPDKYGQELGVSFDQVQQSMDIMKQYDPDYGSQRVTLTGDDLKRYINVDTRISCEFCCGAKAIVFDTGKAACGCAHAQAMRGLAAYLIAKHGPEFTDDQILRELARWKGSYFPRQMVNKMGQQLSSGNYTPDIASLLLDVKLPQYSGASATAPSPSQINNLPGQVGGC